MSNPMRIGLLNACTPAEEVEFNAVELENFQNFLDQAEHHLVLVEYRITEGEFPAKPAECDAYLITGSPKGVYDRDPWIGQLIDFVQIAYASGQKLVGICFGHQLLAHALGGHAEKSEKGWGIGRSEVELYTEPTWMTPPLPQKNLYFCHQDQVKQLPADAKRLGGNAFCPNAMFAIGNQVLGMQGHPEFTRQVMAFTVDFLADYVSSDVISEAATRVDGPTDSAAVAQWIANFLQADRAELKQTQPLKQYQTN